MATLNQTKSAFSLPRRRPRSSIWFRSSLLFVLVPVFDLLSKFPATDWTKPGLVMAATLCDGLTLAAYFAIRFRRSRWLARAFVAWVPAATAVNIAATYDLTGAPLTLLGGVLSVVTIGILTHCALQLQRFVEAGEPAAVDAPATSGSGRG